MPGWGLKFLAVARPALAGGALLLLSTAADAQISYVGPTGNDGNSCTLAAAPCRTLQRGIDVVPAGGDVRVLGSGEYGSAAIAKSLTISGNGETVSVGMITINGAGAVVALRGLDLVGVGQNDFGGVYVAAASAVHIEHCTIAHFTTHGIYASAPGVKLFVTDSILRDNGVDGLAMYYANASASDHGTMTLTFDGSQAQNNGGDGILLWGGASTFVRSSSSGNYSNGVNVRFGTGTLFSTATTQNGDSGILMFKSSLMLESSSSQANKFGLLVFASTLTASNFVLTNKTLSGIEGSSDSTIRTRGNNTVANNPRYDVDPLTPLPGM